MQHRIFHQTTWFRATGACLLTAAIGIASWLDVKSASAFPLKIIQIRPMQPAFRVLPERLPARRLEDFHLGSNGKRWLTVTEAYGSKAIDPPPAIDMSRFRFVENEIRSPIRIRRDLASPRSAILDGWYAPAGDLAQSRSYTANRLAEQAVSQYKSIVGYSEVLNASGRMPSQKSVNDAQQLAVRLIHAVLEDTDPDPPGFAPPPASVAEVQQKIFDALNNTAPLGMRPLGARVWGDLLNQEFPPAIYAWQSRAVGSNEAGIVNFRVDSWLLPATLTTIDVGSYARIAVQSQVVWRELMFPSGR
jgi:hypothetical protein